MGRSTMGVACALWLAGCGGGGATLPIGALLSTSGENANGGSEALLAVMLATEEINRAGGVLGKPLEIVHRDDASDEATARTRASELIASAHPLAVLGSMASSVTLAVSAVTSAGHTLQISGSSTSELLTTADDHDYLFRTCASDALQSKLLAKRALAKGFHTVSVIHRPGAYGQELADAFVASFSAGGGQVPIVKEYVQGQPSYTALLDEVYAAGAPDAIVLVAYTTDAAQIVQDYNTGGFSTKQTFWFFTDAVEDAGFVTLAGASNFTFPHEGTGPAVLSTEASQAFDAAFVARWSQMPNAGNFPAQYYDAVYLVALATIAAGVSDSTAVRDQLRAVASGGQRFVASNYADAARAAAAGLDIDFDGASGTLDFDANGDIVASYDIWKVENGVITVVEHSVSP